MLLADIFTKRTRELVLEYQRGKNVAGRQEEKVWQIFYPNM